MRRPDNIGIGAEGVDHVAMIISQSKSMLHRVDQQNDVGIDAFLEFIVAEETTGCIIAVQIKSGTSYCSPSGWSIPADSDHIDYWQSLALPVCGIVYDPSSKTARWVDISEFLSEHRSPAGKGCHIPVPDNNFFTTEFPQFRKHFLACREEFANEIFFARSLQLFSRLDEISVCDAALWALFSFHRNRLEMWYYLITSLPNFRNHPLIFRLATVLCHIPGHGDIFWHSQNIISDTTCTKVKDMLRRYLSREGLVALLGAVGEGGFERGTVGQGVYAVVSVMPHLERMLESIIFDSGLSEDLRRWAVLMLVFEEQHRDAEHLIHTLETAKALFTEDTHDNVIGILEVLKEGRFI